MLSYYIAPRRGIAQRYAQQKDAVRPDVHIPVDVRLEGDDYIISAMVPGVSADQVNIEVLEDVVSISGDFTREESEDAKYLLSELPTGPFSRSLRLPTVLNASKAEAEVVNGVLRLRVPKAEEAKAKQIKVKTK